MLKILFKYRSLHDLIILFPISLCTYVIQIDKIVKKRWRIIDNTTRYGWLAACYYKRTVSPEDAKMLSALGNKVNFNTTVKLAIFEKFYYVSYVFRSVLKIVQKLSKGLKYWPKNFIPEKYRRPLSLSLPKPIPHLC